MAVGSRLSSAHVYSSQTCLSAPHFLPDLPYNTAVVFYRNVHIYGLTHGEYFFEILEAFLIWKVCYFSIFFDTVSIKFT